jgi:hypothetical protein
MSNTPRSRGPVTGDSANLIGSRLTMHRDALLAKIRALMSKTMDNGCTEHEAMAALAKARAMIDAYEISDEELNLSKKEAAILKLDPDGKRDPHGIKRGLAAGVAKFTDTHVFYTPKVGLTFVGFPSDVQFGYYLLGSLQTFVQTELGTHLTASGAPKGQRRHIINGFTMGCCSRISQRISDLCTKASRAPGNNTALVVVKTQAISNALKANGIKLRSGRSSRRRIDRASYAAGQAAGNRAKFSRPIGGPE